MAVALVVRRALVATEPRTQAVVAEAGEAAILAAQAAPAS
jgi:hypothetical protein